MISFTITHLRNYLQSLHPDHIFNMLESWVESNNECGCILVQFARAHLNPPTEQLNCGLESIGYDIIQDGRLTRSCIAYADDNREVHNFIYKAMNESDSYGYITASKALSLLPA